MSSAKKPKMLVVDDEPDNLDLLYRTFRRDFNVLRAESGMMALDVLRAEGEVAVIISDQRMPEMKGTEFLSKTVPQFPDTMRIILTGFTDVEDLVEAINSGQVYKYITKPWDPTELKTVVQRAAEIYELLKRRVQESHRAQAQTNLLATITQLTQTSTAVVDSLQPLAKAFAENFLADGCFVQLVDGSTLSSSIGSFGQVAGTSWLGEDPLSTAAIASSSIQVCGTVSADPNLSNVPAYQTAGIQAHLVAPVLYRGKVLAVISLQWLQAPQLEPVDVDLINLCAQQAALALV
jgi:CheY-like chemotaxis protein